MNDTEPRAAVVLFLAHQWNRAIERRFFRLRDETRGHADCFLLLQNDGGPVLAAWTAALQKAGAMDALAAFVSARLPQDLGFPYFGVNAIMANTHFPLMRFARERRYRFYWQVESDVELRGNWGEFLAAFQTSDEDLLASHHQQFDQWPTWVWWKSLRVPVGVTIARKNWRKAFFPVCRFSVPAIELIESVHRASWQGHFEVLVPTALSHAGLSMGDLRAYHASYLGDYQNPAGLLEVQSTMRWRPPIPIQEFRVRGKGPLLFHPVKDEWCFDGERVRHWPAATGT